MTHELKIKSTKTDRNGTCTCGTWAQTEPMKIKADNSTIQSNFDTHVQLNKNRGNA